MKTQEGAISQGSWAPREAGKDQETGPPLDLQGMCPCKRPGFRPARPILDSRRLDCKGTALCCAEPLGLRCFVRAEREADSQVVINEAAARPSREHALPPCLPVRLVRPCRALLLAEATLRPFSAGMESERARPPVAGSAGRFKEHARRRRESLREKQPKWATPVNPPKNTTVMTIVRVVSHSVLTLCDPVD